MPSTTSIPMDSTNPQAGENRTTKFNRVTQNPSCLPGKFSIWKFSILLTHLAEAVRIGVRILSALSDRLYDVYHATKSAKELWNLLQGEYGIDDAGIERFNASTFNKFVMVEGKAISDQIHEFQDHLRAVEENGSKFSEDYKRDRNDTLSIAEIPTSQPPQPHTTKTLAIAKLPASQPPQCTQT
ncbi:hypothetical protein RJ639_007173 [Escallonia herrerae]|uniref:Uncharacterized protein n=1 Tax=Escallonia herrerae TaxID=1293975 RepID=A0AA89AXZ8_9ASTE|nr:hypothetical protein RJ639_007173 [Escallonia herrerae]